MFRLLTCLMLVLIHFMPLSLAWADQPTPGIPYVEAPIQEFDMIEATGFSKKIQDESLACDLAGERAKALLHPPSRWPGG